jgi:UDPglucose 6-dehydrogenase
MITNICCIGAGYVGGPSMAVIADKCLDIEVNVVDINLKRTELWNSEDLANLPVFEPGLDRIIERCRGRNLFFSTNVSKNIEKADIIFISVNTPTKNNGVGAGQASDLKWVEECSRQIAKYASGHTIIVEKSTVPVRTAQTIKTILEYHIDDSSENPSKTFSVLSNPEFLAEGTAINDLNYPDRVLIGGDDEESIEVLAKIYQKWIDPSKIIRTKIWSSELSKLTANAFLAQRISSINSIAALCEKTEADIVEVVEAIGSDKRIGKDFLLSGPGFGGSCFQKDLLNLIYIAKSYGLNQVADYWQAVLDLNKWQKNRISELIVANLFGTVSGKKIAIFGFAFKANTNDTRESPSILICKNLIMEGAKLFIYDPKVAELDISNELNSDVQKTINHNGCWIKSNDPLDACLNADAIIFLTPWDEFKSFPFNKIYKSMRKPAWIFDARNCIDIDLVREIGFKVWRIGS